MGSEMPRSILALQRCDSRPHRRRRTRALLPPGDGRAGEPTQGRDPIGRLAVDRLSQAGLSAILGRKVDLNTPGFLSRYFRDQVLAEAETQYVAA